MRMKLQERYYTPDTVTITAPDSILCLFSIYAGEAKARFESMGCEALARQADSIKMQIYNELDARGYFDGVK